MVVAVLSMAGDQLPEIPLFDVEGKVNEPPLQMAGTWVNELATGAVTCTVMEAVVAHELGAGVNV